MRHLKKLLAAVALSACVVTAHEAEAATLQFQGTIDPANTVDFYKFDVLGQIQFTAITSEDSQFDTVLDLFDSNGNLIAEDDNSGPGTTSQIIKVLNTGTFRVGITSFGNFFNANTGQFNGQGSDTGAYKLTIFGDGVQSAMFDNSIVTPIPGAVALLGTGLVGLGAMARRRMQTKAA